MTDAPVDNQPESPAEPAKAAPPRLRITATVWAIGFAVLFAITTILLAIVAVDLKSDRDQLEDDRADVELASARFVQAFVDFRFDDPATLLDDVVPLTADPFTDQFVTGVPQIQALNESLGRVSQGTVKDVFVASVQGGQATAIVVYDALETFTDREPLPYQNTYVRLGLVQLDGEWRVNDVISLNFALQGGGNADPGGASTTTTVASGG